MTIPILGNMFFKNMFAAVVGVFLSPPDVFDATVGASGCRVSSIVFQQGYCSACLAFASSSVLGYRMCLNENQDFLPSPFRLFDCLASDCDQGLTIDHVEGARMQGVGDINATPPVFGWGCRYHGYTAVSDWIGYYAYGESSMKSDIYLFGPAVVNIFVDPILHFHRGVPEVYPLRHVNLIPLSQIHSLHAVVVVGWGVEPEPHWVIQNSWGAEWGTLGRAKVPIDSITMHHAWRSDRYFWSDLTMLCGWILITSMIGVFIVHMLGLAEKECTIEFYF